MHINLESLTLVWCTLYQSRCCQLVLFVSPPHLPVLPLSRRTPACSQSSLALASEEPETPSRSHFTYKLQHAILLVGYCVHTDGSKHLTLFRSILSCLFSILLCLQASYLVSKHLTLSRSILPCLEASYLVSKHLTLSRRILSCLEASYLVSKHLTSSSRILSHLKASYLVSKHLTVSPIILPCFQSYYLVSKHLALSPNILPCLQASYLVSKHLTLSPSILPCLQTSYLVSKHLTLSPSISASFFFLFFSLFFNCKQ